MKSNWWKYLLGYAGIAAVVYFWPRKAAAASLPAASGQALLPTGDPNLRLYTLKQGDTLSALAQRFYGDYRWWPIIWEQARAGIPDPDKVSAGMTISIPVAAPMNQRAAIFKVSEAHAAWWKSGRVGPNPVLSRS